MYRFRKIPALNDDGESNFDYEYGVGFSTKYYVDMKARLDANEWEAKYQQKPFLREGIVFAADELRYYNGVLPEGGFVKNVSACDVAWGGGVTRCRGACPSSALSGTFSPWSRGEGKT